MTEGTARDDDRLDGWKQIATYLNRSVRTAIRWEKTAGLPIHRLSDTEVVYAFRAEIDEWLRRDDFSQRPAETFPSQLTQSAPNGLEAQPALQHAAADVPPHRSRHRSLIWTALALGLSAVAWLVVQSLYAPDMRRSPTTSQPAAWKVEQNTLTVSDTAGRPLWQHPFEFDLDDREYTRPKRTADEGLVTIADLDGDGAREVVMRIFGAAAPMDTLHVFNADGSIRFRHAFRGPLQYGGKPVGPPFHVVRARVDTASVPARIILAAQHYVDFPTVIQVLSASGTVLSEFFANGHVRTLVPIEVRGRSFIAVGGVHNLPHNQKAASLAIVDPRVKTAVAPSEHEEYRCTSCPGDAPHAYLLFSQSILGDLAGSMPYVTHVRLEPDRTLRVTVQHFVNTTLPGDSEVLEANVNYFFDPQWRLKRVEIADDFTRSQKRASHIRKYSRRDAARDERALREVRTWDGAGFVPVATVR